MTDEELLGAWRGGDQEAGEQLFARHFDDIYRFFSRKVSSDVADLVQRTFLKCVESRETYRGDASIRTYLFAIARNELYQFFRERKRRETLDFSVSSLAELGESPSTRLARQGDKGLLLAALERIPLELQIVVELHYWEDMTGPQIAHVLEIPEGTVRSRLRRALERLREAIDTISRRSIDRWATPEALEQWAQAIRPYE